MITVITKLPKWIMIEYEGKSDEVFSSDDYGIISDNRRNRFRYN